MSALELLRFGWSKVQLQLLLAAWADAGPASRQAWAVRAGVPRNHLLEAWDDLQRLGGVKFTIHGDRKHGQVSVHVQPVEFWRVTPLCDRSEWAAAWRKVAPESLDLVTEAATLAEAMAPTGIRSIAAPESGATTGIRCCDRNPVVSSDTFRRSNVSELERSTSKRFNVATAPESGRDLQERIRLFVGERDWRRYWEHPEAQAIFQDARRADVLAGSLRYCQAAIREGVKVRTNTGRMLWEDYRRGLGKVVCQ